MTSWFNHSSTISLTVEPWTGNFSNSMTGPILKTLLITKVLCLFFLGKYYLANTKFQLKAGFITLYRSTCYHLKKYSVHQLENARKVFNLRHSSLRNAIERAFGVLKKRFPIIASGIESHYPVDTLWYYTSMLYPP